jgi:hypothetical protein
VCELSSTEDVGEVEVSFWFLAAIGALIGLGLIGAVWLWMDWLYSGNSGGS